MSQEVTVRGDRAFKEVTEVPFPFMHSVYASLKAPEIDCICESIFIVEDRGC